MIVNSMKKVKTFLMQFLNSLIPSNTYYSKILQSNFKNSVVYFLIFLTLCNFIFISSLIIKYSPAKISQVFSQLIKTLESVPRDINIKILNGRLISNYNRPYFLWTNLSNSFRLFLVIDETADISKINTYNSQFLLTSNELVTKIQDNIQSTHLSEFGNQIINRQTVQQVIFQLHKILQFLPFIYVGIVLLGIAIIPLISLLISILYLGFASIIGYYIYRWYSKKHIVFKKVIHIALHASTLPIIIDYIVILFRPTLPIKTPFSIPSIYFPILYLLLLSFFVFAGIYEAHYHKKT